MPIEKQNAKKLIFGSLNVLFGSSEKNLKKCIKNQLQGTAKFKKNLKLYIYSLRGFFALKESFEGGFSGKLFRSSKTFLDEISE